MSNKRKTIIKNKGLLVNDKLLLVNLSQWKKVKIFQIRKKNSFTIEKVINGLNVSTSSDPNFARSLSSGFPTN